MTADFTAIVELVRELLATQEAARGVNDTETAEAYRDHEKALLRRLWTALTGGPGDLDTSQDPDTDTAARGSADGEDAEEGEAIGDGAEDDESRNEDPNTGDGEEEEESGEDRALIGQLQHGVHAISDALAAVAAAERSLDPGAIEAAGARLWLAQLTMAETAIGPRLRSRMFQAAQDKEDHPDLKGTTAGERAIGLRMLLRVAYDLRDILTHPISDKICLDVDLMLRGKPAAYVLVPLPLGSQRKGPGPVEGAMIRLTALHVWRDAATAEVTPERFLRKHAPTVDYRRFRDAATQWAPGERTIATRLGEALRAGQALTPSQAELHAMLARQPIEVRLRHLPVLLAGQGNRPAGGKK